MNQYGEPWKLEPALPGLKEPREAVLVDRDGKWLYGYSSDEGAIDINDKKFQRIVSCVNACRFISDAQMALIDKNEAWLAFVRNQPTKEDTVAEFFEKCEDSLLIRTLRSRGYTVTDDHE